MAKPSEDDLPLSQLQKKEPKVVKLMNYDDDMSLASLAQVPAGKKQKANGRGRAGGKAKAKAKVQEKGSSSSSSSSSSGSESSDSGEKRRPPATKSQRLALLKKQKEGDEEVEDEEERINNAVKKRDRTNKQQVVADLLCRWWYALPDWPPADDEYYKPKLDAKKLRQVTIQEWEWVPDEDERGFRKVYQLSQFRGVFRNSAGDMIDLRPQESCPCFANFMKKDLPELYNLLVKAYEGQLKDLEKSKYNEDKTKKDLSVRLTQARKKAFDAKTVSGPKRSRTM